MSYEFKNRPLEIKYFIPLIVWAVTIFISSSIEGPSLPPLDVWSADKLIHFGVYAVLAFTSLRAFKHAGDVRHKHTRWVMGWSIIFCLAYGASDEIHQSFVTGRHASILDLFADSIGVLVVHLYFYFHKSLKHTGSNVDR